MGGRVSSALFILNNVEAWPFSFALRAPAVILGAQVAAFCCSEAHMLTRAGFLQGSKTQHWVSREVLLGSGAPFDRFGGIF